MKRHIVLILTLIIAVAAIAGTYSVSDLPNVQRQDRTKHLVNPDGIVDAATASRIDSLLLDIRRTTSMEAVAVIVDDIDTDDIEDYATRLFAKWGLGKKDKDNGLLILVTKNGRAARIEPGYGAEGVLPDVICNRIIQQKMIPYFREGDYSSGLLAGVETVHTLVTDPDASAELKSELEDNYDDIEGDDVFMFYIYLGIITAVGLLIAYFVLLYNISHNKHQWSDYDKYEYLRKYSLAFLLFTIFFIGIPVLAFVLLRLKMNHLRNHPRNCPNCGAPMRKLDEDADNAYLTSAQDLEERIKSVDYDVWLCPECGVTEITSYKSPSTVYQECPKCHTLSLQPISDTIIKQPTSSSEGIGEKGFRCLNCGHHTNRRYKIPRRADGAAIGAAAALGALSGGRSSGHGGSFGGGFGGGLSGGGGATGRW